MSAPLTTNEFSLGEGPLWDPTRHTLFFTDIDAGRLYAVERPGEDAVEARTIYEGEPVGGMTLQHDGALLLFRRNDVAILDPESGAETPVVRLDLPGAERCNDVFALPTGDVLFGTIGTDDTSGGLHRLSTSCRVTTLFDGTRIPNGMALSPTTTYLYYTDSTAKTIASFPYDQRSNALGDRRVLHTSDGDTPDGLACDELGFLYSARWGGSRVLKLDRHGTEFGQINVPVENVTSVTFGGPKRKTLFITTAGGPVFTRANPNAADPDHRSRVIPGD
jgi:sugar lactone lactonase YvrE